MNLTDGSPHNLFRHNQNQFQESAYNQRVTEREEFYFFCFSQKYSGKSTLVSN